MEESNLAEENKNDSDSDLDVKEPLEEPNKYTENRRAWLDKIWEKGENPYPHKYIRTHQLDQFYKSFLHLCPEENKGKYLNVTVWVTGRVNSIRSAGKKLVFYDIVGDGAKL